MAVSGFRLVPAGILSALVACVATGLLVVSMAHAETSYYCNDRVLNPGEGCSSGWAHLEDDAGSDPFANHETCIDAYLDGNNNGRYTRPSCAYYVWETAEQFYGGEWGYARCWNGGTVYHRVDCAVQYY